MTTKKPPIRRRSRGAVALSLLEESEKELATRLSVSRQVVGYWRTGERVPTLAQRKHIASVLGIDADAWDTLPAEEVRGSDAQRQARTLLEELERMQEATRKAPLRERWLYLQRATRIAKDLHKLTDASRDIDESVIVRTKSWARIRDRVLKALADEPSALEKVSRALRQLDEIAGETV